MELTEEVKVLLLNTAKELVLPLLVVDKSINLCKYPSGWFFRHGAVRTGHLILK